MPQGTSVDELFLVRFDDFDENVEFSGSFLKSALRNE